MSEERKKYFVVLSILFLNFLFVFSVNPQNRNIKETSKKPNVIGDIRFHQFTSKIFGNTRTLRVLLPPEYDQDPKKKFPVLYLNDGQDLFDVSTSIFNPMEWKVDETVQDLIKKGDIKPLIVVGIDNAGKRMRPNEYLPFEDKYLSPPMPNPNGAKYPDFLTEEVMPFIENQYRVKTGFKNTGLGGSSYGALITLYTFIKKPNVFGRLLLESPSFYVSEAQILKDSQNIKKLPDKIYLGVGTNEEGSKNCQSGDISREAVQDVLKLKKILSDKKIKQQNLKVLIEDCAIHNEDAWAKRLPEALKFLFEKN
jgi:predicted alpha/beta superfamily hydrolase